MIPLLSVVQPVLLRSRSSTKLALIVFNPTVFAHGILGQRTIKHTLLRAFSWVALSRQDGFDRLQPHTILHVINLLLLVPEQI